MSKKVDIVEANSIQKNNKKAFAIIGIIISAVILISGVILLVCFLPKDKSSDNSSYKTEKQKKKVTVIDFSTISKSEVETWCSSNNVNCSYYTSYSDIVEKDGFISQSEKVGSIIEEGDRITITYSLGKEPTLSQKNALSEANSYLRSSAFSRDGLIEQLEYEGYSHEDSVYAVDNCNADWFEQAVKEAKSYLRHSSFSRDGLIEQLEYEGFTHEQAVYGVEQNGL